MLSLITGFIDALSFYHGYAFRAMDSVFIMEIFPFFSFFLVLRFLFYSILCVLVDGCAACITPRLLVSCTMQSNLVLLVDSEAYPEGASVAEKHVVIRGIT